MDAIDANPFRRLGDYPYVERKLDALKRSIEDVGLWEGVIARKKGNRYEIAFGHHRMEAARQTGLKEVSVVVRKLDDEQMLQFMGRENLEDYNADFATMLETWEAALNFPGAARGDLSVAKLLGWTNTHERDGEQMSDTARACSAVNSLIVNNHVKREDFHNLSVKTAKIISERAKANITRVVKTAKKNKRPVEEVEEAKKQIGKAVTKTAKESRRGEIAQKDLRGQVDVNAYRFAKQSKKQSPLFKQFGDQLKNSITKMLNGDSTSTKLAEVTAALGDITLEEDHAVVRAIKFELGELSGRADKWVITMDPKKVVNLKEISNE
jgi:ParB family chromosome partitioning protein